jgi:hypothetical protein
MTTRALGEDEVSIYLFYAQGKKEEEAKYGNFKSVR